MYHKYCAFDQIVHDKPYGTGTCVSAHRAFDVAASFFWESSNGLLDGEVASAEKGRCDCCKGGTEKEGVLGWGGGVAEKGWEGGARAAAVPS